VRRAATTTAAATDLDSRHPGGDGDERNKRDQKSPILARRGIDPRDGVAVTGCSLTSAAVTEVRAEITASVWQVRTEVGAHVAEGDELVILESMKMEIPITAPLDAVVTELRVAPEDKVREGDVVAVLEP
jgi:biotin carboxyl carrier protein